MLQIACLCVLTMIARTLASDEVACCPPEQFLSISKVKGKAVCFTPGTNETVPASLECEFGFIPLPYSIFIFNEDGKVDIDQGDNGSSHADVTKMLVGVLFFYETLYREKISL